MKARNEILSLNQLTKNFSINIDRTQNDYYDRTAEEKTLKSCHSFCSKNPREIPKEKIFEIRPLDLS